MFERQCLGHTHIGVSGSRIDVVEHHRHSIESYRLDVIEVLTLNAHHRTNLRLSDRRCEFNVTYVVDSLYLGRSGISHLVGSGISVVEIDDVVARSKRHAERCSRKYGCNCSYVKSIVFHLS